MQVAGAARIPELLWCRLAATAWIQPLPWKLPYAGDAAEKNKANS